MTLVMVGNVLNCVSEKNKAESSVDLRRHCYSRKFSHVKTFANWMK